LEKSTTQLLEELHGCQEFRSFYSDNSLSLLQDTPLAELLAQLLTQHGIKKSEAIRRSELSEIYAYQIFSGIRIPERKKLLSLAVGMGLNLSELQKLLKCAGYAQLYVKKPFDCIVIYGVCKNLTVAAINELLFDYGQDTLG